MDLVRKILACQNGRGAMCAGEPIRFEYARAKFD